MNKTKLLTFAVVALLLLNLATLGFLVFSAKTNHPNSFRRPQPREIIIEKLDFDANQQDQYVELIGRHRQEINKLDDQIRNSKQELYLQLTKQNINIKAKDSLINNIANTQKQIEEMHFSHFQDIKKLCRKEQINDFNDLTEELSKIFSGRPKHGND
jgi:periplasmic protein CpxP/Spy